MTRCAGPGGAPALAITPPSVFSPLSLSHSKKLFPESSLADMEVGGISPSVLFLTFDFKPHVWKVGD